MGSERREESKLPESAVFCAARTIPVSVSAPLLAYPCRVTWTSTLRPGKTAASARRPLTRPSLFPAP